MQRCWLGGGGHPWGGQRRRWAITVWFAFLCLLGCSRSPPPPAPDRIISLSPAITETLFAIGAGDRVIGVSDYCDYPPEALRLPKMGTGLTPNYEAIARHHPTLVIADHSKNAAVDALQALAPARFLDWLSLSDVVASTRELGRLSGHAAEAASLADRIEARLGRAPPPDAPRVLVVLGSDPEQMSEVWFIRSNSIHGAALAAAGAINAVPEDFRGTPSLSLEQVIARDPDQIIILVAADRLLPETEARYVAKWRALPISAARRGAVRVLHGKAIESNGPRILDLVEELSAALHEMARLPR